MSDRTCWNAPALVGRLVEEGLDLRGVAVTYFGFMQPYAARLAKQGRTDVITVYANAGDGCYSVYLEGRPHASGVTIQVLKEVLERILHHEQHA